jgi:hypothetical protein
VARHRQGAHNGKFDMVLLEDRGVRPRQGLRTALAAYILGET